jgi:hypothetical protein
MTIEPERSDRTAQADRQVHPLMRRFLLFERGAQPMASRREFGLRMLRNASVFAGIIVSSLGIGVIGYHATGHMGWLDSLYNASMILTGMGPADPRPEVPAAEKWFASGYALFSGVIFLVSVGVLVAPVVHRALHHFHVGLEDETPG